MSGRRRLVLAAASLVALQLALLMAWKTLRPARAGAFRAPERLAPAPAPPLALEREDGSVTDLPGAAAGRPVLVHFWASWCPPCREEMPELLRFARRVEGIAVLPIAVDDAWPAMGRFLADLPRADVHRAARTAQVRGWGVGELPDTFLVDRDGRLVARWRGPQRWDSEAAIAEVEALIR